MTYTIIFALTERMRLPLGPVRGVLPDRHLLRLRPALVRGGHRPGHQPRQIAQQRNGDFGTRR